MPFMNPRQARLIDPILSTVATGYVNAQLVGNVLFPCVPVMVSGGQVIEFGLEAFRDYHARRSPGAAVKQLSLGYSGKPFALVQDALSGKVPVEQMRDTSIVPGIDLASRTIHGVMRILTLSLERDQAALAINASHYDSNHKSAPSGADKWGAGTSDPSAQISAAREAVRASTGVYPNTVLLSPSAFSATQQHPKILDRTKYTSSDSITTNMLAKLWNVETVVVGAAISADDAGVMSDVWGNNVVLAYVPPHSSGMEEPSYGYTYTLDGNPQVAAPYYDENTRSWIYPIFYERVPVLTGITSGFLIANPV